MTSTRPRPFDINTVHIEGSSAAYAGAREYLKAHPVRETSWEWKDSGIVATGEVIEPSGSIRPVSLGWDGDHFAGHCECGEPENGLCSHQTALALFLLRVNPWRSPAPEHWSEVLELAHRRPQRYPGEQLFVYRVEVHARAGTRVGRLQVRLSRARWGRQGLGHETPYPANRLRSSMLEALADEERRLLSWLIPLQPWASSRQTTLADDPRYLEVPGPLVETALARLADIERCSFGQNGERPLRISKERVEFWFDAESAPNRTLRLVGRLRRHTTSPGVRSNSTSSPPGAWGEHPPEPFIPDVLVGEHPCYGLKDNVFYCISNLDAPLLWKLAQAGETSIPEDEIALFLEHYVPALTRRGMLDPDRVIEALPGTVTSEQPTPCLTLAEEGGRLAAYLSFVYGEGLSIPARIKQTVVAAEDREARRWVRRDVLGETRAEKVLVDNGFEYLEEDGRFEGGGERALSFLLETLPVLMDEGWTIEGEEHLAKYRVSRDPVQIRGRVSTNQDWFAAEIALEHGEDTLSMREVFQAWREGRRFIQFSDGKHGMLPQEWLEHNRTLLFSLMETAREREGAPPSAPGSDTAGPTSGDREPRSLSIALQNAPLLDGLWYGDARIEADDGWYRFRTALAEFGGIEDVPVPKGMGVSLRDYQRKGLSWLCFLRDYGLGGILADEMGLGKTIQALALLLVEKQRRPGELCSLVVAPTSVLFNWAAEARRCSPELEVVILHGPERHASFAAARQADLVITSYTLLRRDLDHHLERPYHYVILDEAQLVKNPDSQTAIAARRLDARHRLSMTGTPIENRLSELWSQFAFLMPGLLPGFREFNACYVVPIERDHDTSMQQELRNRVYPFILRRLKEQVASELPPRTECTVYCELEGPQRRLYLAVLRGARERVRTAIQERQGLGQARFVALDALLKLRQICCHPALLHLPEALSVHTSAKLELFEQMLEDILSDDHRILVFSQFVRMLQILRRALDARDISYEYLDGRSGDRQERVDRFNAGSAPVFLISLRAGGTGLNLASADYVVHYDPWWNPAVEDQATDRAHRIGQTRPVFSYKLITRNTVEEKIMALQARKRTLARGLLSAERTFEKTLTREDLDFLFDDDRLSEIEATSP